MSTAPPVTTAVVLTGRSLCIQLLLSVTIKHLQHIPTTHRLGNSCGSLGLEGASAIATCSYRRAAKEKSKSKSPSHLRRPTKNVKCLQFNLNLLRRALTLLSPSRRCRACFHFVAGRLPLGPVRPF